MTKRHYTKAEAVTVDYVRYTGDSFDLLTNGQVYFVVGYERDNDDHFHWVVLNNSGLRHHVYPSMVTPVRVVDIESD